MEMFQKVEALTGLRMEKYEVEADTALLLLERTTEAQQMATMQARTWSLLSHTYPIPYNLTLTYPIPLKSARPLDD